MTGGDNGIQGVWPSVWASSATAFYYLTLVVAGTGIIMMRQFVLAPFGMGAARRDSPLRAEAIGINRAGHQLFAFVLAGILQAWAAHSYIS